MCRANRKVNEKSNAPNSLTSKGSCIVNFFQQDVKSIQSVTMKLQKSWNDNLNILDLIILMFLLQHDNAQPHMSATMMAAIGHLNFKTFPHPLYSSGLVPIDNYLFYHSEKSLMGNWYASNNELSTVMSTFFQLQSPEFYEICIWKLISRWLYFIELDGNYVEIQYTI